MKRILIVYEPVNQKNLVKAIIQHTNVDQVIISGFNAIDWTFVNDDESIPVFFKVIKCISSVPLVGKRIKRAFRLMLLKRISKDYDAIDITYFISMFYPFAQYLKNIGKPYKITFWGSDFYRATPEDLKEKGEHLRNAFEIQVETKKIMEDVSNVYPSIKSKIVICNYGIDLFETIDLCRRSKDCIIYPKALNSIVITCGYNGSRGQQHLKIFEQLKNLPDSTKKQLFLFIPMTYGTPSDGYAEEVKSSLDQSGIKYHVFNEKLTEMELAKLRLQTDIVLNYQVTDALASSLIEHIYAGNIMLVGDWLPYSIYDDYGIRYHKSSISSISEMINKLVIDFDKEKDSAKSNIPCAYNLSSWSTKSSIMNEFFLKLVSKGSE